MKGNMLIRSFLILVIVIGLASNNTYAYQAASSVINKENITENIESKLKTNINFGDSVQPIKLQGTWNGKKTTVKPLVILMEFSDYTHEDINKEETPRDFKDWSKKHYEDMIFGDKTYIGPKGEELFTMKQYYNEQSGGSFNIEGGVAGWYKAKHSAEYYGKPYRNVRDSNVTSLIREAFDNVCNDKNIDLSEYDIKDPLDMDEDGDYDEPDGIIDYLIVIHAGKGEEVDGGTLGENAIWSHRNAISEHAPYMKKDINGNLIGIYDYMIVPQDAGIGALAHEYGHVLGLPDEYNVTDNGGDNPVGYWSVMASGSWAGISAGADPTGFSPWCKKYLQDEYGGNWVKETRIKLEEIDEKGLDFLLDEASKKGENTQLIRIDLPKQNAYDRNEKDKYYLIEWRNHQGIDRGLSSTEGGQVFYDPGLLIWYVDENYLEKDKFGYLTGNKDNNVEVHPGYSFIGVVDSDQHLIIWSDANTGEEVEKASSTYHVHDAAFSLKKSKKIFVDNIKNKPGKTTLDNIIFMNPIFDDSKDYSNKGVEEAGRILPQYGLKVYVTGESKDRTVGKIHIVRKKGDNNFTEGNILRDDITSSFIQNISLDKKVFKSGETVTVTLETNIDNLDKEAVLCYVNNTEGIEEEKKIDLCLIKGKYVGKLNIEDNFKLGNWKPRYVILQDREERVEIIYNVDYENIIGNSANKENLTDGEFNVISKS